MYIWSMTPTVAMPRRVLACVAVTFVGLLAGCGNKPPGCADPAVKKTVMETVVQVATKRNGVEESPMGDYLKKLKMDLIGITTDGYDEGARRHACQATLSVTDAYNTTSTPILYTVQGIEGSAGQYEVAYFDKGYPLHLTMIGVAQSGLEHEKQLKPELTAAEIAALAPAAIPAIDSTPAAAQQSAILSTAGPASTPSSVVVAVAPAASDAKESSRPGTSSSQARPSFICGAKLSPPEQMICDTHALSEADAQMARLYAAAVEKAGDAAAVKQRQRDWRKLRDKCQDVACLQAAYGKRIEELSH